MNAEQIKTIWAEAMPNSAISIRTGILGSDTLYVSGYLAKDKTELSNGYFENDILSYSFNIDENGTYSESARSVLINPESRLYAYGRATIRAKTIKNIDAKKLKKRIEDIKGLVVANKDNLPQNLTRYFDINQKLGL